MSPIVPPPAADLLDAWERGLPAKAPKRGVVLLAAVLPGRPAESLVSMSVAERDVHLLQAHRALFGTELECVIDCAACAAALELEVSVDDLLGGAAGAERPDELETRGWRLTFRPVDVGALIEAASAPDLAQARQTLLRRCVVAVLHPDGERTDGLPAAGLPPEVESELVAALERGDGVVALEFQLTCPQCGHEWTAPFDIASFLWAEIDGWAHRTLREVHLLAASYGWGEREILALSPWRRQAYLQMSGHA